MESLLSHARWFAIPRLALLFCALPLAGQVRVALETELGRIVVELDTKRAPVTSANFLKYVDSGAYDKGFFHRTVTLSNQPTDIIRIEVVQASAAAGEGGTPIPLERTSVTGLRHVDGAVSMARTAPDSATSDFFICIGPQPELDFGGKRNPDGQGFAAFGRVLEGMDVVRRIQRSKASGQNLTPPISIRRASRLQ
jgi:peptidyl-prolyl cis-trans isomerase A (cyclophilin A)